MFAIARRAMRALAIVVLRNGGLVQYGLYDVPICWVLLRDPRGAFLTQALLCADLGAAPEGLISWFVRRWQMEATFQEALWLTG